jgi:hypothetical protein
MSALLATLALLALQPSWRERPSEPWVMPSVDRDGQPVVIMALQDDQWVAYDSTSGAWLGSRRAGVGALDETCSWPWSVAPILHPGEGAPRWELRRGDEVLTAEVSAAGYGVEEEDGSPRFLLSLAFEDGTTLLVTERVECWRSGMLRFNLPVVHLDRAWTAEGVPDGAELVTWAALGPGITAIDGEPWLGWEQLPEDAVERQVWAPVGLRAGAEGEPHTSPVVTWVFHVTEPAPQPPTDPREDGESGFEALPPSEWRGYQTDGMPEGWREDDGALARLGSAGDLVSRQTYDSFEFRGSWRISPGGNSGIFFHATEEQPAIYMSAPEMQVLDNRAYDGLGAVHSAGANYGLHAPPRDVSRPAGSWNHFVLRVEGDRVRHWLNGVATADYVLGSPEWEALVAASKFTAWPPYGRAGEGHLGLQDHGNDVWYRDLRVKRLDD